MSKTILAIGGIYADFNFHGVQFEDSMPAEIEMDGAEYEVLAGGSGVNFARLCVQLGLEATFIGKVGDDRVGELARELLEDAGIHPQLVKDSSVATQIGTAFINHLGQTVMSDGGNANQALGPDDVLHTATGLMPQTDYLYLGGCLKLSRLLSAYDDLVKLAAKSGTKVVVDHGRVTKNVRAADITVTKKLVEQADIYLPSKDEFLSVWGLSTIEQGLQRFDGPSKPTVIVKDGKNGAFYLDQGSIQHAPSFDVEAKHLVGAGDSFNAGFIAAHAEGLDIHQSVRHATAVAALKISGQAATPDAIKNLLDHEKGSVEPK